MDIQKFVWDESYSVQVEEIDEQHKHFFAIVNDIYDLLLEGAEAQKERLIFYVTDLGNYASYHLTTEESLFKEFNFEGAPAHVAAHNLFRDKVTAYMSSLNNPAANINELAVEVADFAKTWLSEHIKVMDRGYIENFHKHGLK